MPHKDPEERRKYKKQWNKDYYASHKKEEYDRTRKRKREMHQWYRKLKENLKCEKCGEDHVACIVFHHKDPSQKEILLSLCVNQGWGPERILKEIAKCDVLCENCHRKLHGEEREE